MMEFSEEYGQSEAITTRLKHITGGLTGLLLKVQPAEQSALLACPCCVESDHIKSLSEGVEAQRTCLHQMLQMCGTHALWLFRIYARTVGVKQVCTCRRLH